MREVFDRVVRPVVPSPALDAFQASLLVEVAAKERRARLRVGLDQRPFQQRPVRRDRRRGDPDRHVPARICLTSRENAEHEPDAKTHVHADLPKRLDSVKAVIIGGPGGEVKSHERPDESLWRSFGSLESVQALTFSRPRRAWSVDLRLDSGGSETGVVVSINCGVVTV